jgi:hypothetical protein
MSFKSAETMIIKDVVKMLLATDNYLKPRLTVDDSVLELIEELMPVYWDLLKEKEAAYRMMIGLVSTDLSDITKDNDDAED